MQETTLLNKESEKVLGLMKTEFVSMNFSNYRGVIENNLEETLWMDVYILLYQLNLAPDIKAFDIILQKLSRPVLKCYFRRKEGNYVVDSKEDFFRSYLKYLITKEEVNYWFQAKYIPSKEYVKEILKFNRLGEAGIELEHISKNRFQIRNTNYQFEGIEEARELYEELFDAYDLFKNLKLEKQNFVENIATCITLGKDKRMLATLSILWNCFPCQFKIEADSITIQNTDVEIQDELTAKAFQSHILDSYQFFRNVVNSTDKKDIVSEIYNKKVSPEIMEQFMQNLPLYLKVVENKDLIDWIITIAKESKYTLRIDFDQQGVFYIGDSIITTPLEAKEYYIEYLAEKKDKVAMVLYKNTIVSKIKRLWGIVRAKFAR